MRFLKNKKENKKIIYIYKEEIKTNSFNPTEKDLIEIFNKKYFKIIMKIEKNIFGGCNV